MVNPKNREKVRSFITPAIVASYFTELKKVLERYNLMNQPGKYGMLMSQGYLLITLLLKFCQDVDINRTVSHLEGQAQRHL